MIQPRYLANGITVQKQMAMALMGQKPTQRERIGEFSEGLPGSALERGMCREKRRELGRPAWFLGSLLARAVNPQWTEQVSRTETSVGRLKTSGSQISS